MDPIEKKLETLQNRLNQAIIYATSIVPTLLSQFTADINPTELEVLPNNTYMKGRNAVNNADINIIKVNASDITEIGTSLKINGDLNCTKNIIKSIKNNTYITARNAADNGEIDLIKLNSFNTPEIASLQLALLQMSSHFRQNNNHNINQNNSAELSRSSLLRTAGNVLEIGDATQNTGLKFMEPVDFNSKTLTNHGLQPALPIGFIGMYDGAAWTDNTTLVGWYACDGTDGTPDLRGKFLRGADASATTGGSDTHTHAAHVITINNESSHTHVTNIDAIAGNTGAEATHTHSINHTHGTESNRSYGTTVLYPYQNGTSFTSGAGASHVHDLAHTHGNKTSGAGGAHTHTNSLTNNHDTPSNVPAYYTVIFIKRLA